MHLADIGEDELVARLIKGLSVSKDVIVGAGDDCALVIPPENGFLQVLKTDCVVEGVHFLRSAEPNRVGWKAMARVVSDMAAMGAMPQHALVTLMLPPTLELNYVTQLYEGLNLCADTYGVSIVGGETSRGGVVVVSVSMTGKVPNQKYALRSGAKEGDLIYVTGRLGGSIQGHHLDFKPRLHEAGWLVENFPIHAMMDLSDGLQKDLPRMAKASDLPGYEIWHDKLPLRNGCTAEQALNDGEDYELLFCVPEEIEKELEQCWSAQNFNVELTRIGRFTSEVVPEQNAGDIKGCWDHFSS